MHRRPILKATLAALVLRAAPSRAQPAAGDVVDADGRIVAAEYVAMAGHMGDATGIAYLYGTASTVADAGLPTWYKRPDHTWPGKFVSRTWQVGDYLPDGHWKGTGFAAGPFASSIAHAVWLPDEPKRHIGVSDVMAYGVANNAISIKPEFPWWSEGKGLDELSLQQWKHEGRDVTYPVAAARGDGRPGWSVQTVVVFRSGFVAGAGSNTASNRASCQLAPGKVPTAIALTPGNEFALVPVWDLRAQRGEVAVIALTGLSEDGTLEKPNASPGPDGWWGEWRQAYPGLPNLGNFAYMKLLGYVPLPDGLRAPTGISATTGQDRYLGYLPAGGRDMPANFDLSLASDRFTLGHDTDPVKGRARAFAKGGVAIVVGKSERVAALIDLKPLIAYYRHMYFGSQADFERTRDIGDGKGQWPHTFAQVPQQAPVVSTGLLRLKGRPSAVLANPFDARRAWLATEDGTLHIVDLPSAKVVGRLNVGRHPTSIRPVKEKAGRSTPSTRLYPDISREVIVTVRGERALKWVRMGADGASARIVRSLQDSRLKDPIAAEDVDNQGTELYLVSVADYAGRALRNYLYGPIVMWRWQYGPAKGPNGMGLGPKGTDPFEYAGGLTLPGRVFDVHSSNIP